MLQDRVNELNSAILEIKDNKIYITGFTREEMLQRYLDHGTQCFSSKGLYDYQELEFHNIKSNALIIIMKNGKELGRHQYKPIQKETIQYKDEEGKTFSLTFTVRKSTYSDQYHFSSERSSELFNSKEELDAFLQEKFSIKLAV